MSVPRLPFKDSDNFQEAICLEDSQLEIDDGLTDRVFKDPVALRVVSVVIAEFVRSEEDPVTALLGEALLLQGQRKRSYLVRRIEDTLIDVYQQLGPDRSKAFVAAVLVSIHVRTMARQLAWALARPEEETFH